MRFYVGCHQPSDAARFDLAFVSVSRLVRRRGPFWPNRWIMDSGAFSEITRHGRFERTAAEYAEEARRWAGCGTLEAIVCQDYMCEPPALAATGLSIGDHQRLTIERYDDLVACDPPVFVLPVLQGQSVSEYVAHLAAYGDRIPGGGWVGVGSVCKRQGRPDAIAAVLRGILAARPDLRLHGFGVKTTALCHPAVRHLLYSADSMAWSWAARRQGRNGNDWREAERFRLRIDTAAPGEQMALPGVG